MERLELLGDSVLKYAVSCHLFLKYPKKHEGQLSNLRQWAICNSNLHKLGINRKLQVFASICYLWFTFIYSVTDVHAHVRMTLHFFFDRDIYGMVRLIHVVGLLQDRFLCDQLLVIVE